MAIVLAEPSSTSGREPVHGENDRAPEVRADVLANLQESMRVAVHGGLATWQVLAVAAILLSPLTAPSLIAAHVGRAVQLEGQPPQRRDGHAERGVGERSSWSHGRFHAKSQELSQQDSADENHGVG